MPINRFWISGDGSCLGQPLPNNLVEARPPCSTGQATQVRRCNAVAQSVCNKVRLPRGGEVHADFRLADGMACVARPKPLATGGHDEAASQSTSEVASPLDRMPRSTSGYCPTSDWSVTGRTSPRPFTLTAWCQVISLLNLRRKDRHQFRIALTLSQSKRSRAIGGSCLRIASCSKQHFSDFSMAFPRCSMQGCPASDVLGIDWSTTR